MLHYSRQSLSKECDAIRSQSAGNSGNLNSSTGGKSTLLSECSDTTFGRRSQQRGAIVTADASTGAGYEEPETAAYNPTTTAASAANASQPINAFYNNTSSRSGDYISRSQPYPAAYAPDAASRGTSGIGGGGDGGRYEGGGDDGASYKRPFSAIDTSPYTSAGGPGAYRRAPAGVPPPPNTVLTQADVRRAFRQANDAGSPVSRTTFSSAHPAAASAVPSDRNQQGLRGFSSRTSLLSDELSGSVQVDGDVRGGSGGSGGSSGCSNNGAQATTRIESQQGLPLPLFTHAAYSNPPTQFNATQFNRSAHAPAPAAGLTQFSGLSSACSAAAGISASQMPGGEGEEEDLFATQMLSIPIVQRTDTAHTEPGQPHGRGQASQPGVAEGRNISHPASSTSATQWLTQGMNRSSGIWSQRPAFSKAVLDTLLDD